MCALGVSRWICTELWVCANSVKLDVYVAMGVKMDVYVAMGVR